MDRWPARGPGLWLLLFGLLCAGTLALALVGFARIAPALLAVPQSYDFGAYYVASRVVARGLPLYADGSMRVVAPEALAFPKYVYPPFLAQALQPLGRLPFDAARALWFGLNSALFCASVIVLGRRLVLGRRAICAATLLLLLLPPIYDTLLLGQVSILILFLAAAAACAPGRAVRLGADLISGVCLGAAAAIKLYPLALVLPLLWYRRPAAIATALVTLLGALAIGGLGRGFGDTYRFIAVVLPEVGRISPLPVNQSLWSVGLRLFAPTSFQYAYLSTDHLVTLALRPAIDLPLLATLAPLAAAGALWGLTLGLGYRLRHAERRPERLIGAVGLISATVLATSPVTHDHYLALLVIPILYLWRQRALVTQHERGGLTLVVVVAFLCLVLQRYWRVLLNVYPSPLVTGFGLLATLLLWGALAFQLRRSA